MDSPLLFYYNNPLTAFLSFAADRPGQKHFASIGTEFIMTIKKAGRIFIRLAAAILTISIVSCAPAPGKKVRDNVWPLPPDEPKIKFVETLESSRDFEGEDNLLQALIAGEKIEYRFTKPYGVTVDKEGKIYVTDVGKIFIFDRQAKKVDFIGAEEDSVRLKIPIGIAVSSEGLIYVTDTAYDKVFVFSLDGELVTAAGQKGEFENPSGLAIDEKRRRLYVVDTKQHNIRAYSTIDMGLLMTIGERGTNEGSFNFPTNITLDSEGNIYVVDTNNFRVQIFGPDGKHIRTIGRIGDGPGAFARPKGIAVDSEGHIYVVDAAFQNFQIFDKTGQILLFVGEAGHGNGQFFLPAGIFVDDEDRIYVVDQLNKRVQVFEYLGEKWKKRQALLQGQPGKN
ncbi:MAG: 6-bladed beta-propeller [Nitrospiraceae bacterium]|nr:MAG: 6-bladed beta-propeller [Nitrospiraceae bacterium]